MPEATGDSGGAPPASVRRAGWWATAAAVIAFAVLATGGSPGALVERGPFSSDFFDEQAHALLEGHLDVDPAVASLEGFVHDGQTHLYFGLVPALLRLPVAALTDDLDGRLTILSMLLALTVVGWATTRLAWRARRRVRGDGPGQPREPWLIGGFVMMVGLASPLLFLASRAIAYHEAAMWGVAGALLTAEATLGWWDRPTARALALASASAALAMGARGSVGSGALAALAFVAAAAVITHRVRAAVVPWLVVALAVPLAAYSAVNMARFDEPLRVPYDKQVIASYDPTRQAVLAATDGSLFGPEFAPTAALAYLRPDGVRFQRLFPWITYRDTDVVGDVELDTLDGTASLPAAAAPLLVLAVVAIPWTLGRAGRSPWLLVVVGLGAGLATTLTIAYIAHRYLADFTPVLVVAAAPGVWITADWAGTRRRRRLPVAGAFAVLTAAGALVSGALGVQYQRLLFLPAHEERRDFVAFQYELDGRMLGGDPPQVTRSGELPRSEGRTGDVTIVGGCEALYWSDGRRQWPLELGGAWGLRIDDLHGAGGADADQVVASAPGWDLRADTDGAQVRFIYDGEVRRVGEWIDSSLLEEGIELWRDDVNAELTVMAGDSPVLTAWLVDARGRVTDAAGDQLEPAATPLCDDLRARLGRRATS